MMLTTFRVPLLRSLAHRSAAIHTLPKLPYAYDVSNTNSSSLRTSSPTYLQALEPHISAEIMELHHTKHHQAYVNGLNAAEDSYLKAPSTRDQIALQAALKFNGGGKSPCRFPCRLPFIVATGHINHTLFWKNLTPVKEGGGKLKDGKFKDAIERDFGSVEGFKKQFNNATVGIQGSGWGWLGYNPTTKILEIVTTPNQDPLLSECTYTVSLQLLTSLVKPTSPSLASTFGNTCVAIPPLVLLMTDVLFQAFYLQVCYSVI
jgi:Fe-Mn family superoxide dismutase